MNAATVLGTVFPLHCVDSFARRCTVNTPCLLLSIRMHVMYVLHQTRLTISLAILLQNLSAWVLHVDCVSLPLAGTARLTTVFFINYDYKRYLFRGMCRCCNNFTSIDLYCSAHLGILNSSFVQLSVH